MEQSTERDQPLLGMKILVADDEFLILVCLEEALRDAGADIVSASTLSAALKGAADETLSAALLDVRLGRQTTETVVDALAARAVPFVFYTGQALPDHIREKHPDAKVLVKPSKQDAFIEAMLQVMQH
jgi:DNA-binding NtrC family response regulator